MIYKIDTKYRKYDTLESVAGLLEDLEKCSREISTLDLSFNTFTPVVFAEVARIIKKMHRLKSVLLESFLDSLDFAEMTAVVTELCDALPRDLVSFEMPSNALSCNYPAALHSFLAECPLHVLNLHNCGLGEEGLKRLVDALGQLEDRERLQVLNLSKNRINRICPSFGALFSSFVNVTDLRLRANTIEETSMCEFLAAVTNERLSILDLSDNFVCGGCHRALGELFLRTEIEHLYLQDAKMDDGGLNEFLEIVLTKRVQDLPGGMAGAKPSLFLDISCLDFEQDSVEPLERLAALFCIKRLVLFDNNYEDISRLREMVEEDGGTVVDQEEEEEASVFEVDKSLLEKIKGM